MSINYTAVVLATVAQFLVGAIWYMAIFGKTWGKMHGFDKLSKQEQQAAFKQMPPYYLLQLILTAVTSVILFYLVQNFSITNPYTTAVYIWLGFMVPTQVSGVIFGGTPRQYILQKILIQAGAALACLLIAVAVFQRF